MGVRQLDDQIVMHRRRWYWHDNQAAIRLSRDCRDPALDLLCVVRTDRQYLYAERWCRALDGAELTHHGGICRIAEYRRPRHLGRNLFEQRQPLPAEAVFEGGKAGDVTARPRQALDEP